MRKLRITIGDQSFDVLVEELEESSPAFPVASAPAPAVIEPRPVAPPPVAAPAPAAPASDTPPPPPASPAPAAGPGSVKSPLAGSVLKINVQVGDVVAQGQSLVILEAMKMENNIVASQDGTVQNIHVQIGQKVEEGHVLISLG